MKRSHEYGSPALSKLISIVVIFAIVICTACTSFTAFKVTQIISGGQTVAAPTDNGGNNATPAPSGNNSTPAPSGDNSTPAPSGEGEGGGNAAPAGGDTAAALKAYTDVVNKGKKEIKSYNKKEFQKLENLNLGGNTSVGNIIQPILDGLMTSEDKAEEQQRDDPADQIPVIHNPSGCLLTDPSGLKSATMTEANGKTTVTLVTVDCKNAEPVAEGETTASSPVAGLFNPMSKKGVDDTVAGISVVKINGGIDLNYRDCTATLVYDTETQKIESLEQIMNVDIVITDAKVTIFPISSASATLINTMKVYNVTY